MYLEKVIFAIDNNADLHTVAKFTAHLEPSYMMDRVDYDAFVADSRYVDKQVCVLLVAGDTRQPCALLFPDGYTETLNPMRSLLTPAGVKDWTYVISTGMYFTC